MPAVIRTVSLDRAFSERLLDILPYVAVFLVSLTHPVDLDLGWHLKYGEHLFVNHALLRENIFSTGMPGYGYLNHSWGSELLLYTVFRYGGFLGISLFGATLITTTFFFLAKAANLDRWGTSLLFPAMLYLLDWVLQQSFRSQYFSFLGLAILVYLQSRFEQYPRKIAFLLPILFLFWANLHGQFIMGLGLFAIWLGFYCLRTMLRQSPEPEATPAWPFFVTVWFLTLVVTMINPYGYELYLEIFRHFGNPLQKFIGEWQPIYLAPAMLAAFLAWSGFLLLAVIVGQQWRELPRHGHHLVPLLLMFLAAIDQRRYFWPMVLLSIPATVPLLNRLRPGKKAHADAICLALLGGVYLFTAFGKLPAWQPFSFDWSSYCRYNSFSPRATEFLKKIAPGHRLLTDYDLGGWLIWNYPEIKPAVDGRMPFWRDEKGYSAYQEYLALETGTGDIDASPYDLVYWPPQKAELYAQLTALAAAGKWQHLYDDPFASIFIRSKGLGQDGRLDGH